MLGRSNLAVVLVVLFAMAGANAQTVDCGCETAPLPAAWAKLNGKPIGAAEVAPTVLTRIAELQNQVVDVRKGQLDILINLRLLDLEAAKLKVTAVQLLQNEIGAKTKRPTDAEIEAYFNANKAAVEAQAGRALAFADVKDQLRDYLTEQNRRERANAYADQLRLAYGVKKLVNEAPVPKSPADRQRVLATIGTANIRSEDVETSLRPLIYSTQTDVYRTRKDGIDLMINDDLLEAEATRRGVTVRAVLDAEVTGKVPVITEAQAQSFFNENRARINGDFVQVKSQIFAYLQDQEQKKLETAFAARLRAAAQIQYLLPPPVAPTYTIDLAGRPIMGTPTAPVTIAAFVDFQCPTCAEFHETLLRVIKESNGRARLAFLNYPLDQHKYARKAAEAAEAAREQGKFWEYAALLYKNQQDLSVPNLKALATAVGLNRANFDAALDSGKYAALVERQSRAGDAIGVHATPTIFINGRPVDAYNYVDLKAAVDAAQNP